MDIYLFVLDILAIRFDHSVEHDEGGSRNEQFRNIQIEKIQDLTGSVFDVRTRKGTSHSDECDEH